ncbi:MAG: FKBP-type peptidyl-prolyl cis-trans isomerase [Deltaproteobacteria bacterium]|nr:FKBP-type peptidyl-prolyl cis-trans isomerase [Deltaproteobacteria bacterium]MBW2212615.1 FKBP-type peptidyl-prolyl cis-trans isomerase [Deltaproteobacteria bacterium]MBW2214375.1 FKBP-type peptidyl-prolyl cis-trans isomerase [Deltaproteobacteria bacterium]MBW2380772.1 FKBP-type peptidyl-prolyl cis-trans isomerase [Deltaproteobacteria bacterium]MBW2550694.1 FKBP-type peptidyl-prolyl cis-trans isomerase [Deltaproteobacteria bacterium]
MKTAWTLLCCVVLAAPLTACKSSDSPPAEGEAAADSDSAETAEATKDEVVVQNIVAKGTTPDSIPAPPDVAAAPENAPSSESGLAWTVLQEGTGDKHPSGADIVTVNYTGWTTDGRMFDSSTKRGKPAEFPLNRVIKGWTEGVALMVSGEKRRFWIPGNLAYGEATPNDPHAAMGPPRGTLVFDVELLSFKEAPKPPDTPKDVAKIPKNAEKTKSGIGSRVLTKGTGKEHPTATSVVTVHYSGWTTDGNMFDSSIVRGTPTTFGLNQVIPGWTEGLQLMVVGEKRRLWIPEKLAYAGRPGRPAGMLVFDVELISIKN